MSWNWLLLIALVVCVVVKYRLSSRKDAPLPPGPPGDPLIGHLRLMPPDNQDVYFYELGLKYGNVVHLKVLNKTFIILNSVQAAIDLLDKRGANNSDRPPFPVYTLIGLGNALSIERYGSEWRRQRAMVQQHFNKEKSKQYHPLQTREAHVLALNLLSSTTEDTLSLFMRFSTGIIIDISYGHTLESTEDSYFEIAHEASHLLANSGPPGGTPVDLFPLLQYLPSWFPGTYYATYARKSFQQMVKLFEYPYEHVEKQMAKGLAKPSFLASLIEEYHARGEEDESEVKLIKQATGTAYFGGAETTSSTLSFFLLAMVLYPEIQIRAQEEIDRVVGSDRLPELQDRESLPFIECILQETIRWHQPLPSGVPHRSMVDDVYNGMLIPKGSIIIANARSMSLDEAVYKDPFKYDPARFLPEPEGRGEPYPIAHFGFGRRICPGRYLAEDSVFIAIATILATTTISRTIGADGKEIVPDKSHIVTGIITHPGPFPCQLKPRDENTLNRLQRHVDSSWA